MIYEKDQVMTLNRKGASYMNQWLMIRDSAYEVNEGDTVKSVECCHTPYCVLLDVHGVPFNDKDIVALDSSDFQVDRELT